MLIEPSTDLGPLGVVSNRVSEVPAHGFVLGSWLSIDGAGFALADNGDSTKIAYGVVAAADADFFSLVSPAGEIVTFPKHGLGAGGQRRWLEKAGGTVTTPPAGGGVEVRQLVLIVVDADHILIFPPDPWTI